GNHRREIEAGDDDVRDDRPRARHGSPPLPRTIVAARVGLGKSGRCAVRTAAQPGCYRYFRCSRAAAYRPREVVAQLARPGAALARREARRWRASADRAAPQLYPRTTV